MRQWQLLTLVLLAYTSWVEAIGLLAIDYGTDSFKASLVAPGVPFDIVYNRDSKRKTPSVVTLRGEDRVIGGDAATLATRFPKDAFASVKLLVGHGPEDDQAALHARLYANTLQATARNTTQVLRSDGTALWVEEILAMQFGYARDLANAAAKDKVQDVVVTIPVFFDHFERRAVLDALELANLRPLALVNDGAAVAVNYAMSRTFPMAPEPAQYHLFYDAGAGSVRATVVAFQTSSVPDYPGAKTSKNVTSVEVKGVGFDRTVGGLVLDDRIRNLVADQFEAQHGKKLEVPLRKNARAMAKLLKESGRVKEVLSANLESAARIENLAEDVDLNVKITRDDFEAACADLNGKWVQPIADALHAANLTAADLTSVVLVGGVSRVRMVQTAIKTLIPEHLIATNLNADEAAAMGALLFGASLSRQYRTKDIRLVDYTLFGIDAIYEGTNIPAFGRAPLFPVGVNLGSTEILNLTVSNDFSLRLVETPGSSPRHSADLLNVTISGVTKALTNKTAEDIANSRVMLFFVLTESGVVTVPSAQLIFPAPDTSSEAGKPGGIFNLFGGQKESGDAADGTASSAPAEATGDAKPPKPIKIEPISLFVRTDGMSISPLSTSDKVDARKRLRDLEQAETRKRNREEARNSLESYVYRLRDHLVEDGFVTHSTDEERLAIQKELEAAKEWLWEAAEKAPTKELRTKKTELEKLAKPIHSRIEETARRPTAVTEFRITVFSAQAFHSMIKQNHTAAIEADEPLRHTLEELNAFDALIAAEEKWLKDLLAAQEALHPHQDPILRTSELERRARNIQAEQTRLSKKRAPRRTTTTTTTSSTSPVASETATASEPTTTADSDGSSAPRDEL